MFVSPDAKERILTKRRNETLTKMAQDLVLEVKRLLISDEELLELIRRTQEGVT